VQTKAVTALPSMLPRRWTMAPLMPAWSSPPVVIRR
jgi:hypothetical protein